MKIKENDKVQNLLKKLQKSKSYDFPEKGKIFNLTSEQGVYIILHSKKDILHVGRTYRGSKGLQQRLKNHLHGNSSFMLNYSKINKQELRTNCQYKCIKVKDSRQRALLESLAVGSLCPKYIGSNESKIKLNK